MPAKISVQLYSVREQAGADYEGTIRAIADMGFDNVEPAGFPGTTPEDAAKLFKELGIKAPSCHCGLPVGDNKNKIIETAQIMGHEMLVTGCPPNFKENFKDADTIKATAELYCEAAANAAEHGLQIGAEVDYIYIDSEAGNISLLGNVVAAGPFIGYKVISNIGFTFDAQVGAQYITGSGEASEPNSQATLKADSSWIPLINLNIGWSF